MISKKIAVAKIKELIYKEKQQYKVFIGLSVAVTAMAGALYYSDNFIFERFIGYINPLIASITIIITGFILLSFALFKNWFAIYRKESLKKIFRNSILALLFVPISMLVDIKVGFAENINILFPKSLLFYPVIGFFAEILFHVLPLSLLLMLMTSIANKISLKKIFWICILIVSLLEPFYQTIAMFSSSRFPIWASMIVLLNLFLFNLIQLLLLKKYDFISMYSFRLVYYLVWHIAWGYFRLQLLF